MSRCATCRSAFPEEQGYGTFWSGLAIPQPTPPLSSSPTSQAAALQPRTSRQHPQPHLLNAGDTGPLAASIRPRRPLAAGDGEALESSAVQILQETHAINLNNREDDSNQENMVTFLLQARNSHPA